VYKKSTFCIGSTTVAKFLERTKGKTVEIKGFFDTARVKAREEEDFIMMDELCCLHRTRAQLYLLWTVTKNVHKFGHVNAAEAATFWLSSRAREGRCSIAVGDCDVNSR
jgi:hypothetical protein